MPPQKRGMTVPEDSAAYMMGAGVIAGKAGYNLPAPIAILSTIFEGAQLRSEEHTSELQSLMRISYAVFCLKKKNIKHQIKNKHKNHLKNNSTTALNTTH